MNAYEGLNGQDAHDYLRIARGWSEWSSGGVRPEMAEHPHGYPMLGVLVGWFFGSTLIGLRVVSALSWVVLVLTLRAFLRRNFPEHRASDGYVLLALAVSPFLLRYSTTVMSDVPGIALIFLAFDRVLRWIRERSWWSLVIALLFVGAALSVRLAVVPIVGALFLVMLHGHPERRTWRWSVLGMTAIAGLIYVVVQLPADSLEGLLADSPLAEWSPLNLFRRVLHSDDGTLVYRFPNVLYVLGVFVHPGFLPIGVFLLPFFRRSDLNTLPVRSAAGLLGGYLLFIAGMPFQNDRVLLMALPFVAVLMYPSFFRAWDFIANKGVDPKWITAFFVAIQFALFARAIQPFMDQARTERELAAFVNEVGPKRIYTHGMGAALANYCAPLPVMELWYAEVDHFDPGAVLVVRPANLSDQWAGLPPALNWQRAQAQGVVPLLDRPDGWVIVRAR